MPISHRSVLAIACTSLFFVAAACGQVSAPVEPDASLAAAAAGLTASSPHVFVVAHQDDDFLFPGQEIYQAISKGAPTAVVFVTAGNVDGPYDRPALTAACGNNTPCLEQGFIEWRMAGSLAAYFDMAARAGQIPPAAVPAASPSTMAGVSVLHGAAQCAVVSLPPATKNAYRCQIGTVSLYYLGLSASQGIKDGYPENVEGYTRGSGNTLEKLFEGTGTVPPLDVADSRLSAGSTASYSRAELVDVLAGIYQAHGAEAISTLDMTLTNHYQLSKEPPPSSLHLGFEADHSDHIHAALFAHEAMRKWVSPSPGRSVRFATYRTYNLSFEAANVPCSITVARAAALTAYGKWDWGPSYSSPGLDCNNAYSAPWGDYEAWLARSASAVTRGPFSAARIGAPGGNCLHTSAGAGLGLAACAGAARFSYGLDGRLVETTSGRCLTAGAAGSLATCGAPLPSSQQWSVLTNGQIRQANGQCLGIAGGSPGIAECTPWSETPSAPRATFDERWTLRLETATVSPAYPNSQNWASDISHWGTIRLGDVNGDGKADACGRGVAGVWCALSTGAGVAAPTLWTTAFGNDWGVNPPQYSTTMQLGDLNGDGKADVCMRVSNGVRCALSKGSSFGTATLWTDQYADAQGWADHESYWGSLRLGDVTGDGKADLCGRWVTGLHCMVSNGSELTNLRLWAANQLDDASGFRFPQYGATLQLGDVDGDGKADACARAADGVQCMHSDGNNFGPLGLATPDFSDASGAATQPSYYGSLRLADLDGDGRADVCGRTADGVRCGRSSGVRFDRHWDQVVTSDFSNGSGWLPDYHGRTLALGDLDGDGRADVCGRGIAGMICSLSK